MEKKRTHSKIIGILFILINCLIVKLHAEPPLRIVGSSAAFPFAATVAEHFSYKTHKPIPLIEAIGTGAGIKLFCGSLKGPDGVITSRPLTEKEKEKCRHKGITFEEFVIGQDGLIFIQNKQTPVFSLTLQNIDQALSEGIQQGKDCIKNPYRVWSQIQSTFPSVPIRVLGPAPTSGTYDILIEKAIKTCGPFIRRDGLYIEAPANENLIIQKVLSSPETIGIVTFSFYDQHKEQLHALPIQEILPSFQSIQDKSYSLSRPLYFYVKTNNLGHHPARRAYTIEFTSNEAVGEEGYLTEKGLIPLSPQEQQINYERAHFQRGEGS